MPWLPPDEESCAALLALQARTPLLIALYDPEDVLRHANPAFREAFGLAPDATPSFGALMRHCHRHRVGSVIETADLDAWLRTVLARRGKQRHRSFECDLHDGRWIHMDETMDDRGWMMSVGTDVTALRSDQRALRIARDRAQRAAMTDALTQVSNRPHVLQLLADALDGVAAGGPPHCIAIVDLDHFKQLNDSHGHPFGDAVLVDFARMAQQQLRRSDAVGRIGGEEFMLLLGDATLRAAVETVDRLRRAVGQPRAIGLRGDAAYTFSAGVTRLRAEDCIDSAYARADRAMYLAKRRGRDRVIGDDEV